jgi:hypothetical protein
MTTPLPLPTDYNPETFMLVKTTEYGTFHESRRAARLAAELVTNGAPADLALAARVLDAALACQERDPADPHCGNFYWMREDSVVEDLNAVEFVLEALIPMMLDHGERLSPQMRARVREAIRLGLDEIARLDVLVAYTNITALDILNTCLGGQLLDDAGIAARGQRKLVDWMQYTTRHGHPLEYNSPTYTRVTLRALKELADRVQHAETRQRARAMAARLALSVALHIHGDGARRGTGRWAGPHSRAYQPSVVGETPPEVEMLRAWLADGTAPAWVGELFHALPDRFQVTETAERDRHIALTTYHTPGYALGTATSSFHPQSDVCMVHYRRPHGADAAPDRPGVLYTRYVLNDKWFGDAYHPTDRTRTRNLPDEGDFYGAQEQNRAIGVYAAPLPLHCASAKLAFIWTQRAHIDEIWIGEQRVETLPAAATPADVIVIGSGDAYMAVRPLHVTPLGRETPVQLVERDGDLVLELYNYRGPEKRFWEMRWPQAFYKGRAICAFYLETAERGEYADGAALARAVAAGDITSQLDAPFTFAGQGERLARFAYARDGQTLGIEVDLMLWQLRRRWTERGELGWPMLDAPFAGESADGHVRLADAELRCDAGPGWLVALPEGNLYIGGSRSVAETTVTLTTPNGTYSATGVAPVVESPASGEIEPHGGLLDEQYLPKQGC